MKKKTKNPLDELAGTGTGTSWSELYTGKRFHYEKMFDKDQISILDIAHSLSMICRFNGHCHSFYSVAEHCCHVSDLCKGRNQKLTRQTQLLGLLHDSSEAYIGDIVRPMKLGLWFGNYNRHQIVKFSELEQEIQKIIIKKYVKNLKIKKLEDDEKEVIRNDNRMLATEARDLMKSGGKDWNLVEKPVKNVILPMWDQLEAKYQFLERFEKLTDGSFKKEIASFYLT